VTVNGRRAQVERVAFALAVATRVPNRGQTLEVKLTAVDERGEPVDGVALKPDLVNLTL
jgi:YbbR domain-containing protein